MKKLLTIAAALLIGGILGYFTFAPTAGHAATPPLTAPQGGTGWGGFASGAIPYGLGVSSLRFATTTTGSVGDILKFDGSKPVWVATSTLGLGSWGSITGTLSDQLDLQAALDNKYETANPNGFISTVSTDGVTITGDGTSINPLIAVNQVPALTTGSVLVSNGTTFTADPSNFFYDVATHMLGIGTSTPYAPLSIGGNVVVGAPTAGGTFGDLFLPNLGTAAGSFLAVDAAGKVIATDTPSGSSGVPSVKQTYGSAQTGAITLATSTTAINNDWGITNSSGAFTFNLPTATASIRGLLSGADWTTFNSKLSAAITSLNGLTAAVQTFATTSSNGGWGFSSNTSTHTLNIPTASATNPLGLLSSTDWSTFNGKESVLTFSWPLIRSTNAISFGGLSTSTAAVVGNIPYFSGVNTFANVATSSLSVGTGLTNSGTLGSQVGGTSASISFASIAANSLWANQTGGAAVPSVIATSSLFVWNGTGSVVRTTSPALVTPDLGTPSALTLTNATGLPIVNGTTGTLSVARGGTGTTTAPVSQVIYGGSAGIYQSVATGTVSAGNGITISATIAALLSAASIAVDQAANFAWTGTHNFAAAVLRLPYSTAPTIGTNGDVGVDSTSNQFKYYSGSAARVLGDGNFYPAFSYSTSTAWTGTTTIPLGPAYTGETWNGVRCFTDAGTVQVSFNDGSNRMNFVNASTTVNLNTLSSNNTFTANTKRYVDLGTPASSPTKVSCTVSKSITAD